MPFYKKNSRQGLLRSRCGSRFRQVVAVRQWKVWCSVDCVYICTHMNIYNLHGYPLHSQGYVYYKQLQSPAGSMFVTQHLKALLFWGWAPWTTASAHVLLDEMHVKGCGEVPQERPSGGTPTSSSFDHPARALLHRHLSCTYLDTLPETVASTAAEETGLGRQEPCDNRAFCISLQIFLAAIGGQNGSHPPHVLCLCSLNFCRCLSSSTLPPAGHGHIFPLARIRPCACLSPGILDSVHP